MVSAFPYLRDLSVASIAIRLTLAMLFGGMLGLKQGSRRRAAGFRTYMMVCMGAALAMLLGEYEHDMLMTRWSNIAALVGTKTDTSRFGAQVINGVGFLGAGTIIVTGRKEVKGLTTAAGLWASACMGLAIGAGFYECVFLGFVLIYVTTHVLPIVEEYAIERARNMNLYVEFSSLDDVGSVINIIKAQNIRIYEVDLERGKQELSQNPSAVFLIRLSSNQSHLSVMAAISELPCIKLIDEI